jgi:acetolactate decarboxylase
VKSYLDLQSFVKSQASAAGIDVSRPFAFLIHDRPAEIGWHINVDRTDGENITPELFAKSKVSYVLKDEAVDIVGFYSDQHDGVFISRHAPAVPQDGTVSNAIHIHFVSRISKATGHIDNITLGQNGILRLPSNQ